MIHSTLIKDMLTFGAQNYYYFSVVQRKFIIATFFNGSPAKQSLSQIAQVQTADMPKRWNFIAGRYCFYRPRPICYL